MKTGIFGGKSLMLLGCIKSDSSGFFNMTKLHGTDHDYPNSRVDEGVTVLNAWPAHIPILNIIYCSAVLTLVYSSTSNADF